MGGTPGGRKGRKDETGSGMVSPWSCWWDSNPRPPDYKSGALPTVATAAYVLCGWVAAQHKEKRRTPPAMQTGVEL